MVPCTTLLNYTVWTYRADNDMLYVWWNNTLKFMLSNYVSLLLRITCSFLEIISKGWSTLWTMKLSQDDVRALIGCWTCLGMIFVYTREKMAEGPWRLTSPKYNFKSLINALTWSNGFCVERGKRSGLVEKNKGPWYENVVNLKFYWIFFGGCAWYGGCPSL